MNPIAEWLMVGTFIVLALVACVCGLMTFIDWWKHERKQRG